jgi:hypothetical protein
LNPDVATDAARQLVEQFTQAHTAGGTQFGFRGNRGGESYRKRHRANLTRTVTERNDHGSDQGSHERQLLPTAAEAA